MDGSVGKLVLNKNIELHAKEAPIYEIVHPHLFNWYHKRKSRRDIDRIVKLLACLRAIRMLDLGCGTGFVALQALAKPNVRVTAVDLSEAMLAELGRKIPLSQQDRIDLVCCEATDFLRGTDDSYDWISASAILHHLVDCSLLVELALKKLKSGGILYLAYEPLKQAIADPVRFFFHSLVRNIDESLFRRKMKRLGIDLDFHSAKGIADYHTTLGGVDPLALIAFFQDKGDIVRFERFATRANGFLALIADGLIKSQNTFSVIFQKN